MAEYIEREATLYRMKVDIAPPFKVVSEMPAADVALVRHGRWIYHEETIRTLSHTRCSVCSSIRYEHYVNDFRFCPSCGARMDGGDG